MNPVEQRQERRRERLERAAKKAEQESAARHASSRAAVEMIPFGQPILVDHYSARRHRNAIKKMDRDMGKAVEASKRAAELNRKADAVGTGGIQSDDPEAIEKLRAEVAEIEAEVAAMKRINAWHKKHGSLEGCPERFALVEQGWSVLRVQPYYGKPFPPYAFTNRSSNRRRIEQRIMQLQRQREQLAAAVDADTGKAEQTLDGGATLTLIADEVRAVLRFPARLSKEHYKLVRSQGWLWSPSRNGFTRRYNEAVIYRAKQLATTIATAIEDATNA